MSTMNIESRQSQSFVYPHFHDTKSTRKTNKDIEIDKSVYHLLSLYLNADSLDKINPNSLLSNKTSKRSVHYPYTKTKSCFSYKTQRNWLGEEECHYTSNPNPQDILVNKNTVANSKIIHYNDTSMTKINKRSKSVSFNETVTIIISQDNKSSSQLKQHQQPDRNETEEDDDSIFVDALEFI